MGAIFILFFAGIAIAVVQNSHRSSNASWAAAADHLHLRHTPGNLITPPRMHGTVRGISLRVEIARRQHGGNRAASTVYSVALPASSAPAVVFRRQHAGSFLRSIFGGHDVVVGDPRFDDTIVVDSADARSVTEFLTPARRAAILSIFSSWHDVDISGRAMSVSTHGRARDASEIVRTVNRLVDAARVLTDPEPLDTALGHLDEGDLHASAEALHELNANTEPNVVAQMLEAETLVADGEANRAAEIVEEVALQLPADPEVGQLRDFLAAAREPQADDTAEDPDLTQQAVIDDLFSDSRFGVAIDARFAEAFVGREVTWTGTVEQSRPYRSDADFGTDPGTKTTVGIGAVGSSRLMSNQVKAVVDLPDGTEVTRGETITFRGSLRQVDRFTRKFFVHDAQIV